MQERGFAAFLCAHPGRACTDRCGDSIRLPPQPPTDAGCIRASTSEYDIQSVQYAAVERTQEKTFEIEIRKSCTIRKSIPAHSREEAVERAEILYEDGGFDGEFDESTMDVSFEVITETPKVRQVR